MDSEAPDHRGPRPVDDPGGGSSDARMSRRALLGRVSAGVAAGTVAWIAPEIFTTKPAAGASLSGPPVNLAGGVTTGPPVNLAGGVTTSPSPGILSRLAFTGLDLQRDAEVGAALVAAGGAVQHWASRRTTPEGEAGPDAPGSTSAGEPA